MLDKILEPLLFLAGAATLLFALYVFVLVAFSFGA